MNSDDFSDLLLSNGDALTLAVERWFQSGEMLVTAALELLSTLALVPGTTFDFQCVKPWADGGSPSNIRALALDILLKTEPEHAEVYLEALLGMFYNDNVSSTVIQILHDLCLVSLDAFAGAAPAMFARSLELLEVPDAAILVADLAPVLEEDVRREGALRILAQAPLCIERADSVFRLCQKGLALPPEALVQIAAALDEDGDPELLECVEAVLAFHPAFIADPLGQEALFGALQRGSVGAFRLCLKCCADVEIAPQLLLEFARFADDASEDLDPEMHAEVAEFLARHQ
jgi:hypothetical protein